MIAWGLRETTSLEATMGTRRRIIFDGPPFRAFTRVGGRVTSCESLGSPAPNRPLNR